MLVSWQKISCWAADSCQSPIPKFLTGYCTFMLICTSNVSTVEKSIDFFYLLILSDLLKKVGMVLIYVL